ncbi:interaptin-like [Corticium candelabrum]|uniref:interaptin-like n=1 Tax=Corticium candelabrum TaxID=121492 RepID=UPI002E26173C|nr:interaptin-like [Corticium candelabrum]
MLRDDELEIKDLSCTARSLHDEDKLAEAESSYRRLLELYKRTKHQPRDEADALLGLVDCLYRQHKMNEVDVFTEQCLSFLQDITPQDEKLLPQLYNALHNRGACLYEQGKYERASGYLRESINIQRSLPSVNKESIAETCFCLSRCLLSQFLTKEAEDVTREAYALSSSIDSKAAEAATLLAYTVQLNEGSDDEVKQLLQQAEGSTSMVNRMEGKAYVLSEMAELLMLRKEHVRAIEALKEAASLQRRLLPTNHHHTALTLCRMAECLVKLDKQMDALLLFHESSELISKIMGDGHPIRGRCLFGVGQILVSQQKCQEAESILKESVNILCHTISLHPTTNAAIRDLNYCLQMLKKDRDAIKALQQHQQVDFSEQSEHDASAFQADDLHREMGQLRESNQAIEAEKSALQQQLRDEEVATRVVTDESEHRGGQLGRLRQLARQRDEDRKQLQAAICEQERLTAQKQKEATRLQQQIARVRSQLDDKERQLQRRAEKISGMRVTMNDMNDTIEEQRRQINSLRQESQELDTANEHLTRDLQRSYEELRALIMGDFARDDNSNS